VQPWTRLKVPGKVFTLAEVERWKRKAEKREWKVRNKVRQQKMADHETRQVALHDKIWDRKVSWNFLALFVSWSMTYAELTDDLSLRLKIGLSQSC
tara:strand:+ start:355 stop:642 length:288 start_codon:yes stop_codon:yes gene_type:complete